MTNFEQYLLDEGCSKHIYNTKKMCLEKCDNNNHTISTMVNLDYRYLKGDDIFTFGLSEYGKPPTLIHPRPRMKIIRNGEVSFEKNDDNMNFVLQKISPKEIIDAIKNETLIELHDNN